MDPGGARRCRGHQGVHLTEFRAVWRLDGPSLVQAVERLEQFPDSGRMVPEFRRQDVREVLEGRYRIVYRRLAAKVEILAVWHGARLLKLDL